MNKPVIYIFVNKGIEMSSGKVASQVAHATALALAGPGQDSAEWPLQVHRTIIVLGARSEQHLQNIQAYLAQRGVRTYAQIDEGVNEVDSITTTAVATQILEKDRNTNLLMSSFDLYENRELEAAKRFLKALKERKINARRSETNTSQS